MSAPHRSARSQPRRAPLSPPARSSSLVALIALSLAWELWLAPLRPGRLRARDQGAAARARAAPAHGGASVYTLQWTSMLVLLYLAEGIVRGMTDGGLSARLGWLEALLALVFFVCALAYVAPYKRAARAAKRAAPVTLCSTDSPRRARAYAIRPGIAPVRPARYCRLRFSNSNAMNASARTQYRSRAAFVAACTDVLGAAHVLTDAHDTAPFLTDWRRRYTGHACAVLLPADTQQVAAVVRLAREYRVAIVPQGGNTGLAGGATPDASGAQAVVSLRRLNRIRDVDPHNNTITVEAGVVLAEIQARAEAEQRLFALSLAAEGSCMIGGNLSTNAGGTGVLRYGNTRELCLGLEVVTPQGEIWDGLRALRKDNTGYDLRDLYIGAEGTLGIITAAVMKLHPAPVAKVTALAGLASPHAALDFLAMAQRHAGALLTGFELMSDFSLRLVGRHFGQMRYPFAEPHAQTVLLELSDSESEEHARALFERLMEEALEEGIVEDAVVAENLAQSQAFWDLREHIPLAQAEEGLNIKQDISVPISSIGRFIDETDALIAKAVPGARMVTFGHLGDGNLHYNVQAPEGVDPKQFLAEYQKRINTLVYEQVHAHRGSISAEHGLGQLKVDEAMRYKSPVEVRLMQTIKAALDPENLMNPGKVVRWPERRAAPRRKPS